MAKKYRRKRTWKELEPTEKLGYAWVFLYVVLIVGTASAIIVPAYKKWQLEHAEKTGFLPVPDTNHSVSSLSKEPFNGFFRLDGGAGAAGGLLQYSRLG